MWDVTGWAFATWLKSTLILAVVVGVCWLILGSSSGWFWAITTTAVVIDGFLARQLSREWRFQASMRWWWTR